MRFTLSLVAIAGAVAAVSGSLVVRQTLPSTNLICLFITTYTHLVVIPGCAVSCLTNADFGSCSHSDNSCLCHSQSFINSTTICITNACSGADLANAEAYSQAICRSVVCFIHISTFTELPLTIA